MPITPDVAPEPPVSPVPTTPPTTKAVTVITDARGVAVSTAPTSSTSTTTEAANTDTWGIPGPTFLAYYGGAIVAAIVLAKITKRLLVMGGDSSVENVNRLGVYETAGLNAGPELIASTAVARLQRLPMTVNVGPDGQPIGQGFLDESKLTHPVEQAVLRLWRSQPGISLVELSQQAEKLPEVETVMADLRRRGLLLSPARRQLTRLRVLWPLAVIGLGAARIQAGAANNKPVLYLALMMCFTGLVALVTLARPVRSRRGEKLLRDARKVTSLRSMTQSAMASRVPLETTTMLGMAVFGTAVLWEADGALAGAMAVPRNLGSMPTSSSDGGSGSGCGGGGGGCGGGGCGGGGCGG